MLLKTRVREYPPDEADCIMKSMVEDFDLAQNVNREPRFITGDFVDDAPGDYMARARDFARVNRVEVEVVPASDTEVRKVSAEEVLEALKALPEAERKRALTDLAKLMNN